jgi:hypothetical protein
MSKESRFREYTRSVWRQGFEAHEHRCDAWHRTAASAIEALLAELRGCANEEELHARYWEPGDWPAQVLLRHLPSDPGPETLLELEHVAFWLRCQELMEER